MWLWLISNECCMILFYVHSTFFWCIVVISLLSFLFPFLLVINFCLTYQYMCMLVWMCSKNFLVFLFSEGHVTFVISNATTLSIHQRLITNISSRINEKSMKWYNIQTKTLPIIISSPLINYNFITFVLQMCNI